MTCPKCGTENPEAARFCGDCGTALGSTVECVACGTANPAAQRFCHGCGQVLAAAAPPADPQPAPQGERKQVTVMFVDVQSSMELAGSVDDETWRTVMERLFSLVAECVTRFDGTVDKFTGDGAMALFGAPVAHEDHAVRACHTALLLGDRLDAHARTVRRDHGLGLSVRIGLNSGEVVVGGIGAEGGTAYTAIGNTVGLAARMEALAEPGRPYLTKSTAALVDGYFALDDVGELDVKGVHGPVHTFALTGVGAARTRLDVSAGRGLSRFVGRTAELEALEAAYERSRSGGQVVGVVADPGIGKSRLCREFTERCRADGIAITEGRGVAHGRRIPLLPVVEMLRGYFGIGEEDDSRVAREKIAGRLLLIDEAFRATLPVLFGFLGIDGGDDATRQMNPEARERALFAVIGRLVSARADEGGGVVLVEDLHWLDPGSEAFLAHLIESLPATRTLVIVNFRPEYSADWMQRSFYERLPLLPLPGGAIAALVRDLIGDDSSLDGIVELIAERTGGNPFFIEEVVLSLVDAGALVGRRGAYRLAASIDRLEIPPTVQAVLAARIDRLDPADKAVLEAAAVIGREFSEPVLQRVTALEPDMLRGSLGRLCAAELVFEQAVYPIAQYVFKHPLTEEVAYRTQLRDRRAHHHAAAAAALADMDSDRLEENAGLVSNHWEQAREPVQAAHWGARAAVWAGQSHPADALRHWRRVRALLEGAHDDPEAAGLALGACLWILQFGWRQGLSDEEVEAVWREGLSLAERSGNTWAMCALHGSHAVSRGMVGAVTEALEHALEAQRLGRELGDLELEVSVGVPYWMALLGHTRATIDELSRRIERMGEDYDIGRRIVGFSTLIWSTFFLAQVLTDNGRIEEARTVIDRALRLAREHDDVESLGWTHTQYAMLDYFSGEVRDGLAHARAGTEVAERIGSAFSRSTAYCVMGYAHLARGEWADAIAVEHEALRIMGDTRTGLQYEAMALAAVAEAQLGLGDPAAALASARRGADAAERGSLRRFEAQCRVMLGRALAGTRPDEGNAQLDRALELIADDFLAFVPQVSEARAELDGRDRWLGEALAGYERIGAHGHARRVRGLLAGEVGTAVE